MEFSLSPVLMSGRIKSETIIVNIKEDIQHNQSERGVSRVVNRCLLCIIHMTVGRDLSTDKSDNRTQV